MRCALWSAVWGPCLDAGLVRGWVATAWIIFAWASVCFPTIASVSIAAAAGCSFAAVGFPAHSGALLPQRRGFLSQLRMVSCRPCMQRFLLLSSLSPRGQEIRHQVCMNSIRAEKNSQKLTQFRAQECFKGRMQINVVR